MNNGIIMGPVAIKLRDFFLDELWSVWQWKLNTFVSKEQITADFIIDFAETKTPVKEESPVYSEDSGFFRKCVYLLDDGRELHTLEERSTGKTMLSFLIGSDTASLLVDETESFGQAAFEFIGPAVLQRLLTKDILSFHGVLMEASDKGIILSAPSETGKTTHAHLWRDTRNALILNGDNACCYRSESGWTGFSVPWSGTSGECINRSVPIKALVLLEQAEENIAEVLSPITALAEGLQNVRYPSWNRALNEKAIELFGSFLEDIPVIRLRCRPDEASVEALEKVLNTL